MKQKINLCIILSSLMVITIMACNEKPVKAEAEKTEISKTASNPMASYDPAMDPIKVEADFNKVLADTLNVKLHEVTLNPGDSVGMHTHPDFTLYVLEGGKLKIYSKEGEAQVLELPAGAGLIFPGVTHSGKNVGTTAIKLLVTDIYRPRN